MIRAQWKGTVPVPFLGPHYGTAKKEKKKDPNEMVKKKVTDGRAWTRPGKFLSVPGPRGMKGGTWTNALWPRNHVSGLQGGGTLSSMVRCQGWARRVDECCAVASVNAL